MGVNYVLVNFTDSEYLELAHSKMSEMYNETPMKLIVSYLSQFTTIPKDIQFVDTNTFYDNHVKKMKNVTIEVIQNLVDIGQWGVHDLAQGWILSVFEEEKALPKYAELMSRLASRTS